MLTFNTDTNEDTMFFDSSSEWSLQKTTKLLSEESMYSSSELFPFPDHGYNSPSKTQIESVTDLVPAELSYNEWQSKFIELWSPQDCLLWLIHELQELKVTNPLTEVKVEQIAHMNGKELRNMNINKFNELFPGYGIELFQCLQKFKPRYSSCYSCEEWQGPTIPAEEVFSHCMTQEPTVLTDLDNEAHYSHFTSPTERDGYKSDSSVDTTVPEPKHMVPEKRRPGRPRGTRKKKKPEKLGRLWEFIRDLLLNPQYNPSMICWENYEEGMFRFVHSDRVAKLWGSKKENEDMNYEKLSRAMRYYYKSQVLLPVYGKRLVYKFGPTATGWRSENPIMRCQG